MDNRDKLQGEPDVLQKWVTCSEMKFNNNWSHVEQQQAAQRHPAEYQTGKQGQKSFGW